MTTDLAAWLTAIWDEREKDARYLLEGQRADTWLADLANELLARIAADRKILASQIAPYPEGHAPSTLVMKYQAEPYKERPGFRPEWLVERQGAEQP